MKMNFFNKIKRLNQKLAYYPRLRVILIITGVIIISILFMNFLTSTPNVTVAPQSSIPATNINLNQKKAMGEDKYKALAHQRLVEKRQQDATSGKSFIDGVFTGGNASQNKPKKAVKPSHTEAHTAKDPVAFFKAQQQEANAQAQIEQQKRENQSNATVSSTSTAPVVNQQQLASLESRMQSYLNSSKSTWTIPTAGSVQVSPDDTGGYDSDANGNFSGASAQNILIKAGSIMYAVIDTEVDSDIPGPIMATIVSGRYKGAKLLGTFTRPENADKLVLQFQSMNIKNAPNTISINAYAVNAVSAQNALADDVNHHYLFRYGSLLGGAFLEGFGNAYRPSNICSPGTKNCFIFPGSKTKGTTTTTATYQAFGQMGEQIGNVWQQNFDVPPTIKIHQGKGMGILFMSDITPTGIASTNANTTGSAQTASGKSSNASAIEKIVSSSTQNALVGSALNTINNAAAGAAK